jgi:hypothetical protein
MANLQLEAALAIQDRKKRLEAKKAAEKERRARERHKKSPAEKQRREERERKRKREEWWPLYKAQREAEQRDDAEAPLYEVILDHVDIADPKFAALRARLIVSVKRPIAELECSLIGRRDDHEERRLARAREILATLTPPHAAEPRTAGAASTTGGAHKPG